MDRLVRHVRTFFRHKTYVHASGLRHLGVVIDAGTQTYCSSFTFCPAITACRPDIAGYLAGDGGSVRAEKVLGSFFSLPLAPVAHRAGGTPGLVRVLHRRQILLGERLLFVVFVGRLMHLWFYRDGGAAADTRKDSEST